MTTITVSTIGASGDYATIAAWATATDVEMVTADLIHVGEIIDAATFTEDVTFGGGFPRSAQNYRWLRAATEVAYNGVDGTGAVIAGKIDASGEDFVRISGFKIASPTTSAHNHVHFADGGCIHSCWVDTKAQTAAVGVGILGVDDLTVHGCVVVGDAGTSGVATGISATSGEVLHTTVYSIGDSAAAGTGIAAGVTCCNTGVGGSVVADFATPVGAYLVSEDATAAAIPNSTASIAPGDYWQDVTTEDFRPLWRGPLITGAGPYTPQPRPDAITTLVANHPLNERLEVCNPWTGVDTPDGRLDETWSAPAWTETRRALGLTKRLTAGQKSTAPQVDILSGTHWTVSTWCRFTTTGTQIAVCGQDDTTVVPEAHIEKFSDGTVRYVLSDPTGSSLLLLVSTTTVEDGLWHHLVARGEGAECKLWVDGVLEDTETRTDFTALAFDKTCVGGTPSHAPFDFVGDIADVRIWSRALSDQEITDLHEKPWDQYESNNIPALDASQMSLVTALGTAQGGVGNPALENINVSLANENATALGTYTPITIQIPWLKGAYSDGEGVVTMGTQTGTYVLGARAGKRKRMCHIRGISVPGQDNANQGALHSAVLSDGAVTAPKFTSAGEGIAMIGGATPDDSQIKIVFSGQSDTNVPYTSTMSQSRWEQVEDTPGRQVWLCDEFHTLSMRESTLVEQALFKKRSVVPGAVFDYKMHVKMWMYFYPGLNSYKFSAWIGYDDLFNSRWTIPVFPTVELNVPDTWDIHVKNGKARGGSEVESSGGRRRVLVSNGGNQRIHTGGGFMVTGTVLDRPSASAAEAAEWDAQEDDKTVHAQVDPDEIVGHVEGIWDFRPKLSPAWVIANPTDPGKAFRADKTLRIRGIIDRYKNTSGLNPWTMCGFHRKPDPSGPGSQPWFKHSNVAMVLAPDGGNPLAAETAIWAAYDCFTRANFFHWSDEDATSANRYKKVSWDHRTGDKARIVYYNERIQGQLLDDPGSTYHYNKSYQTDKYRWNVPENPWYGYPNTSDIFGDKRWGGGSPRAGNPAHQGISWDVNAWFYTSDYVYQDSFEQVCENWRLSRQTGTTNPQTWLNEYRSMRYERRILTYLDNLIDRAFADKLKAHMELFYSSSTTAFQNLWTSINDGAQDNAYVSTVNLSKDRILFSDSPGAYEMWESKFCVPIAWRYATYVNTADAWTFAYEIAKTYVDRGLSADSATQLRHTAYVSLPGHSKSWDSSALAPGTKGDTIPQSWIEKESADAKLYTQSNGYFDEMDYGGMQAAAMIMIHQGDAARATTAITWAGAIEVLEKNIHARNTTDNFYEERFQSYEVSAGLVNRYGAGGGNGGGAVNFEGLAVQGNSRSGDGQFSTGGAPVTFAGGSVQGASTVRNAQFQAAITKEGRAALGSFNLPVIF